MKNTCIKKTAVIVLKLCLWFLLSCFFFFSLPFSRCALKHDVSVMTSQRCTSTSSRPVCGSWSSSDATSETGRRMELQIWQLKPSYLIIIFHSVFDGATLDPLFLNRHRDLCRVAGCDACTASCLPPLHWTQDSFRSQQPATFLSWHGDKKAARYIC